MTDKTEGAERSDQLHDTPHLADALENERFKQFLDHVPLAVAVAELQPPEHITYANIEFERVTSQAAATLEGRPWSELAKASSVEGKTLSDAIPAAEDYLGVFTFEKGETPAVVVDAWSNVIENDEGVPLFRLVALAEIGSHPQTEQEAIEQRVREKDTLLRELQHRVKNNLQMITALIRLEARNQSRGEPGERFERLAGRVGSLALLYKSLTEDTLGESVDLGVYLSQIASAVMQAHAVEGIHLELKVDTWPVSVNVAMPAGLVVNELLTNSLKHAFAGRKGGTIKLQSLVDQTGCRVIICDDGVGLPEGTHWPQKGKLSALIVQSLRQNAKARVEVESAPGRGMCVTIFFARADAMPEAAVPANS